MNSIKSILFGTRIRIICTSIALVIGLYALVGFFLIPRIAKPKIVETISTITGRETTLEVLKEMLPDLKKAVFFTHASKVVAFQQG